jgi:hypothetical protein
MLGCRCHGQKTAAAWTQTWIQTGKLPAIPHETTGTPLRDLIRVCISRPPNSSIPLIQHNTWKYRSSIVSTCNVNKKTRPSTIPAN